MNATSRGRFFFSLTSSGQGASGMRSSFRRRLMMSMADMSLAEYHDGRRPAIAHQPASRWIRARTRPTNPPTTGGTADAMRLSISVTNPPHDAPRDVVLGAGADTSVAAVAGQLGAVLGTDLESHRLYLGQDRLDPRVSLHQAGLREGARVALGGPAGSAPAGPPDGGLLEVRLAGGPLEGEPVVTAHRHLLRSACAESSQHRRMIPSQEALQGMRIGAASRLPGHPTVVVRPCGWL